MAVLEVFVFIAALLGLIWTAEEVAKWREEMGSADTEGRRIALLASHRRIVLAVAVETLLIAAVLVIGLRTWHVL